MESKGIDVSYAQGDINWSQVADNIGFAMIRASYGTSGIDSMFERNIKEISKTSLPFGVYHYCYAMNTQEAINEAKHFINTIRPYTFYYPAALDMEETSIAELGKDAVTNIILAFINTLRAENYYPILYVDLNWIKNYIDINKIPNLDIWLSEWGTDMSYTKNVTMWQYSPNGVIPGTNGAVNMNNSYKNYQSIIKQNGYNGTNRGNNINQNESNLAQPVVSQTLASNSKHLVYRVVKGDTLWGIAQKFLGDGNKYQEIMLLNNLSSDIITPGQLLKIPPKSNNIGFILYRVRRGDSLWKIAQKLLCNGERYPEIMNENNLQSDKIYAGQLLRIPLNTPNNIVEYTVKAGDNLWNIATRFLGDGNRYREIMSLNNLSSDIIYPGEKLKIPPK